MASRIAVMHTLEPGSEVGRAEWLARLAVATKAWLGGKVDKVMVLGGWYRVGDGWFYNPDEMKRHLTDEGVCAEHILLPLVSPDRMNTIHDIKHSGDEVRQAIDCLASVGIWEAELELYIVSNDRHLIRLLGPRWRGRPLLFLGKRGIWPAWVARSSGFDPTLLPLPSPNQLGWKWFLFRELPLLLYTLIWDPCWIGWLARKIHSDRCRGGHGVGG